MNRVVNVLEPGLYTTVQDRGRPGYLRYGMPTGGAMDRKALAMVNEAIGNELNAAVLEATGTMPVLAFPQPTIVAVANATGVCCHKLDAGDRFQPEPLRHGYRAYIGFDGGIDVPLVMGSRSTYVPAGIGGFGGRILCAGDVLPIRTGGPDQSGMQNVEFPYPAEPVIRVMPGPEAGWFDCEGLNTFLNTPYTVTSKSDRTGLRLAGQALSFRSDMQMVSAGLAFGTIQVPPSGQPIIMMADHPTSGGYPRIGNVAEEDLSVLAQLRPGDWIRFVEWHS